MIVAVYLHAFYGKLKVVGPFDNEKKADHFIGQQVEPLLWRILPVLSPDVLPEV